jgi:hypothetical protein
MGAVEMTYLTLAHIAGAFVFAACGIGAFRKSILHEIAAMRAHAAGDTLLCQNHQSLSSRFELNAIGWAIAAILVLL